MTGHTTFGPPKQTCAAMVKYCRLVSLLFSFVLIACSSDSDKLDPLESDDTPPTLELSFSGSPTATPGTAIIVSQEIEVSISAEDANGIQKVEAFLDGDKVGEDTTAPFLIRIDISQLASKSVSGKYKDYILEIVATDRAGNTATKQQTINVDNEIPLIDDVSLPAQSVINGSNNPIAFQVVDNEGLASISLFLNDELFAEIGVDGPFESNIDTSSIPEGPNILKIEAVDLAGNTATFEVNFISDNLGPEISFQNLTEGLIIDQIFQLNPSVIDEYSEVASVEIKFDDQTLMIEDSGTPIDFGFDPEGYEVGEGTFEITATDGLGNTSRVTRTANIHRRLIEINIPENWLSPYVVAAVVFVSRMDGSNLVWEEIVPSTRQVILSVPEEFDMGTEFMVTFFWQDNGGIATLSTHQNLSRGNPGTLNLTVPPRRDGTGLSTQIPIANFLSNDVVIGESATSYDFFRSVDDAPSSYTVYLDTAQDFLNVSTAVDPLITNPFDQVYVFDFQTFSNILIPNPVPPDYVMDKGNMTTANLESRQLQVSSSVGLPDTNSVFRIAGALSPADDQANKYHEFFFWNRVGSLDTPMNYLLNTTFYTYRHALQFGSYYTERKGLPLSDYTIPNVSVDYSITDTQIDLTVQGTEHAVGRAQCFDFDDQTYAWNITFDSQSTGSVVIPELPVSISHPVKSIWEAGNIEVEKVELVSYAAIPSFDDYIVRVLKNQSNILEATDWYQLVYKSRTGDFTVPIRDFLFQ